MNKIIFLLIMSLITFCGNQASALSLESYNEEKVTEKPIKLAFYLAGVRDGISWSNSLADNKFYCPPSKYKYRRNADDENYRWICKN